ncbi:hypothetical protein LX92_03272 [Maribacter polysiphoniae]|uniref:Protease stability complex PrcB-like protein n=2 Tax=Maribacter polysiphoniae TaxID=429344 RepID=A0A316EG43_9FLAO|nr:hypothetical protein LX92_03272 [Maribacter polysiphoniae]
MRYLSIFIFTIIFSCNGQKKAAMEKGVALNESAGKLTMVLHDNYSGSSSPETLIIKDSKSLKKFFIQVNKTRKPGLPVPEVDFTKEMVLIHCSGEQPLGRQITLAVADENEYELIVRSSIEKKKGRTTSSVIVSPFRVYKMPLTSKKITFQKER